MNAIQLLEEQHRELETLFTRIDTVKAAALRRQIFERIADAFAVHTTIEERHFYPAVNKEQTEDLLLESVEEHLEIKRLILDLLNLDGTDESFAAKVKVLRANVERHMEDEEKALFPKVEKLLDEEALQTLAEAMEDTWADLLRKGDARRTVSWETEKAAQL